MNIDFVLHIRTKNGLNAREHWRQRSARVKAERTAAFRSTPAHPVPCIVTMTRLGPGTLDDDNLQGALKAVRDGIADRLGYDDRHPGIRWQYGQERAKEWGVRIQVEAA